MNGKASKIGNSRRASHLRFALTCLVLAVPVIAMASSTKDPHPISRFVASHPDIPTRKIELGTRLQDSIKGPEIGRFVFEATAGDFIALRVAQRGQDMVATLFDPAGKLVDIADKNNVGEEEIITFVAKTSGRYALQVAVFDWRTADTDFEVEMSVRQPTAPTAVGKANQLLDAWYRPGDPGAAIAVIENGETILERYLGLANVEYRVPVTASTRFDLASVSKQFTGYAVAMLIAQGELGLDQDIRTYLPEVPDFGKTITIGHLVNHTSGLRDWDAAFGLMGQKIEDGITNEEVLRFVAAQRSLNFDPGNRLQYSNTGYALLASIVERVTGQPFDAWTRRNIFVPLGMRATSFNAREDAVIADKAMSYEGSGPSLRLVSGKSTATMGSASVNTTVADLVRWLAYLESEDVGAKAVLNVFRTEGKLGNGEGAGYAFGRWYSKRGSIPVVGHLGLGAGYRTSMQVFPERNLKVIFLSNNGDDSTYARAQEIENLFLGIEAPAIEAPSDDSASLPLMLPVSNRESAAYLGAYYSEELSTVIAIGYENGRLVSRHAVNGRIELSKVGADVFSSASPFMAQIKFVRDSAGTVTGFLVSSENSWEMPFRKLP